MDTVLKKPPILRDDHGRFEQHGATMRKHAKNTLKASSNKDGHKWAKGESGNPAGRKKGVKNRVTTALKDLIVRSLDELGGVEYLKTLAVENSSAYSSLLGKVLPVQRDTEAKSDGGSNHFIRVIVMPNGDRYIEGVTPKQLPAPAPHVLPSDEPIAVEPSEIKDLDE